MKQIWILYFLLLTSFGFGQSVIVVDLETGEPLSHVNIMGLNTQNGGISRINGEIDMQLFESDSIIQISHVGYQSIRITNKQLSKNGVVHLESTQMLLDELVLSNSRWQQSKWDIPAKISSVSTQDIVNSQPQTSADLLNISGDVFVQKSQQGGGSPMIRGFSTNRLLYSIDGVRMNTAIFRGGNIQNVISIDPYTVDKTEILFGSNSVLYGSDAIGGVMNFSTLKPSFLAKDSLIKIEGKGGFRYSSVNNEKTYNANIELNTEKVASLTSFTKNNYGNVIMGSYGPEEYLRPSYVISTDNGDEEIINPNPKEQVPTAFEQKNFLQKILFKPNEKLEFDAALHFSETSNFDRYDRHLRARDGKARYGEWYYGPQKWLMAKLSVHHKMDKRIYDDLKITTAYQRFEESRNSRNLNSTILQQNIEKVDAYSLNMDFKKNITSKTDLFYGVEGVLNQVHSEGKIVEQDVNRISKGPSRYPDATWMTSAIYASTENRFSPSFILQAGVRYSYYFLKAQFDNTFIPLPFEETSNREDSFSGNIGMVKKLPKQWTLSTNLSLGFRAPNVDDIGKIFDSEPGNLVVPNTELGAEYAYNVDVGIAKKWQSNVVSHVTAFYTLLDNALVRADYSFNGSSTVDFLGEISNVQAIQNAAQAQVYGVQWGMNINLENGFYQKATLNWQQGEELLSDGTRTPLRHAAPMFGMLEIGKKMNKWSWRVNGVFNGEKPFDKLPESEKAKAYLYARDANGDPYSPSWYTINGFINMDFIQGLHVILGVENITDQRYRPFSSGMTAPGRNFVIALRSSL